MPVEWTHCLSVGVSETADCRIVDFQEDPTGARFTLKWQDGDEMEIAWQLPGIFNARNAAMAINAQRLIGLQGQAPDATAALAGYKGVKRRQELHLNTPELVVLEDFGHHPTAIRETLISLRARYPDARLTVCFEPRSNTACTAQFQGDFTNALAHADACYLAPVFRADRYAEDNRLDTTAMANDLTARGTCSGAFSSFDDLVNELIEATENKRDKPRVVVVFSNGSFGGKLPTYVSQFSEQG